jgi:hypothetical protein
MLRITYAREGSRRAIAGERTSGGPARKRAESLVVDLEYLSHISPRLKVSFSCMLGDEPPA